MASFVQAPTPVMTAAVTSGNVVFGSNVTKGNLLICWLRMISPQTVTDNLGDGVAWKRAIPYFGNNSPADKAIWYKVAGATGACTVTGTGTSGTFRCAIAEFSGQGPFQRASFFELRAGGTTWSSGNIQANVGDLVIAGIAGGTASDVVSAGVAAPNSNFTKLDNMATGYIAIEDNVNWAGGLANATFTLSVSGTPDGFAIVFGLDQPVDP